MEKSNNLLTSLMSLFLCFAMTSTSFLLHGISFVCKIGVDEQRIVVVARMKFICLGAVVVGED